MNNIVYNWKDWERLVVELKSHKHLLAGEVEKPAMKSQLKTNPELSLRLGLHHYTVTL